MIHIVTDSTATILPEILAKHSNIHMVSLTLCIDGEYVEESKTTIDDVIAKLKGIECGRKGTSCPDQIAIALEKIKKGEI